jgi:hypothetical protein
MHGALKKGLPFFTKQPKSKKNVPNKKTSMKNSLTELASSM